MAGDIRKEEEMKGKVVWLFGRPCSGKTTLANNLEKELAERGVKTISFDGDQLRTGLNKDLGFSITDRKENIRRSAELASLFASKGYCVVCSFVTPTEEMRNLVKTIVCNPELMLFYVEASLSVCISRDTKGHYKNAKEGKMANFTGITSPFEEPKSDENRINTEELDLLEATQKCLEQITQ